MDSAYFSLWYNYPPRFKKMQLMFMIRSSRTIRLKANGYIPISLETFASVSIYLSFSVMNYFLN